MAAQQDRTVKLSVPWYGATKIFSSYPKISIYIRDSIRRTLGKLKDQCPFNDREKGQVVQWVKELNADKDKCPGLPEPTAEEYKQFVDESFKAVDNEDRTGNITMETVIKFREVAYYLSLLENFGMYDEEMKKHNKYCVAKAIDIAKALKSGVQPRRGGFKEEQPQQPKQDDNELEREVESMSNQIGQMNNGNYQQQQQQQQYQMNNNFGYGGQNNFNFGNGNNQGGFSNPYGNPQQQQQQPQQYGYDNNMNNYNNNNNNNIQMNPNYNPKKKGIRLKFGGNKKDKQEQDIAVGPRTSKVKDDPNNRGKKQFEFPNTNLSVQVPVRSRTIEYYKVLDNIKKVNYEGLRSVKKGRLKEALNYIEDSLEYLKYVQY